ncbi:MAG: DUF3299 domain-containing protein [Pseudomonadota bacterium]
MRTIPLLSLSLAALLAACGDATDTETSNLDGIEAVIETAQSQPTETANGDADLAERGVTLLSWEDLMPEGEEALLTSLYEEFYREFEERMMQQQSTLMSAADSEAIDLSMITEGSDLDTMEQIGTFNVVEDLNGKSVRIPGYIVPLDFSADAEHKEFLLVPYFGACLHTPPPPPNQIIFVTSNPPAKIPDIYDPVWLEGSLTTGRFNTEMGDSAYELSLSNLELYEF